MNAGAGQSEVKVIPMVKPVAPSVREDEFLVATDLVPVQREAAERSQRLVLAEIEQLTRENRWADILAAFHPVASKLPELCEHGLDGRVREKIAFALGQSTKYDEAIAELQVCVRREPENFYVHASLAYTAYDSLYAAKNHEIFLSGKIRADRVQLAHEHFRAAQALRLDGVTNFYREGMLWKQIEGKTERGLPLFQRAVANWDKLTAEEKQARHQERKNFVKALYQLAACLADGGRPLAALQELKRCLAEDEQSGHLSLVFKYFALGKVNYLLNRFPEARDALLFALRGKTEGPVDFVHELLARTYLALRDSAQALEAVSAVPEKKRRPYVRWTEADVLCALGDYDRGRAVLRQALERDQRSRHKTLLRLCKIDYLQGDFKTAFGSALEADRFFREKWGNPYGEGLFWQAVCAFKLGENEKARGLAEELKAFRPNHPKLDRLMARLSGMGLEKPRNQRGEP
jgi:tetratricopeptide (TPR) repeat protein